jgi:hypothetical protein
MNIARPLRAGDCSLAARAGLVVVVAQAPGGEIAREVVVRPCVDRVWGMLRQAGHSGSGAFLAPALTDAPHGAASPFVAPDR